MTKHCCNAMTHWANYVCDEHLDPFECPDQLVTYDQPSHLYGLIVRDGGSSSISIQFCPWCGADLRTTTTAPI